MILPIIDQLNPYEIQLFMNDNDSIVEISITIHSNTVKKGNMNVFESSHSDFSLACSSFQSSTEVAAMIDKSTIVSELHYFF